MSSCSGSPHVKQKQQKQQKTSKQSNHNELVREASKTEQTLR